MFKFTIDKKAIELLCEVMKKNNLTEIEVKNGSKSIKLSKNIKQNTVINAVNENVPFKDDEKIKNIDKGLFPKAFCKIVPDYLTNDQDYCLVMHADGAGTKSSLAYMYWKETNDLSVWKGIAQDALVMNIDDLLCVGADDNILLSSTIGLSLIHI